MYSLRIFVTKSTQSQVGIVVQGRRSKVKVRAMLVQILIQNPTPFEKLIPENLNTKAFKIVKWLKFESRLILTHFEILIENLERVVLAFITYPRRILLPQNRLARKER